ncbi:speckle-type POZ protein [Platysternon megacephalum]|uniref:Speckle-type POZ protein n=1 Tax=Platysternon megacephalum TaxID=55544 RepID=A0A4D9EL75_9SAUR|nr:speckle-type POZ protein [Platysternon megacephalum]
MLGLVPPCFRNTHEGDNGRAEENAKAALAEFSSNFPLSGVGAFGQHRTSRDFYSQTLQVTQIPLDRQDHPYSPCASPLTLPSPTPYQTPFLQLLQRPPFIRGFTAAQKL